MNLIQKWNSLPFPLEMFLVSTFTSLILGTMFSVLYFIVTEQVPNYWVVGIGFNAIWMFTLYESVYSCYRKGAIDQMRHGNAFKM
ncbi:hypothetical protein [Aestuariibacter salexigens]|uniref:hypothetical protein n=1 Tax=Aestuariibacter salexigens TaxID=226010 RepID=UPI000407030D|nr:hypothetical protein [Aestuariibacter salexigens]